MKTRINEGALCMLVHNHSTSEVDLEYMDYVNPLEKELQQLQELCNTQVSLQEVINFIQKTHTFNVLAKEINYCEDLDKSYQSITIKNDAMINKINKWCKIIEKRAQEDENFDINDAVTKCKNRIVSEYTKGCKAFAIEQAFRFCLKNKNIITFSHRRCGWSQPVYQLTPNFSIEVKTNFGYGRSSYFFSKLIFKGIEIVPFSEWVQYEIVKASEIVRYSAEYPLENDAWEDALRYCREACNLSLKNEEDFISKYLVGQCELMVNGLELLLIEDAVFVESKDKHHGKHQLDRKGYYLTEYKGEKISGALNFISKIASLDSVILVSDFISRIEECNNKMHTILSQELTYAEEELNVSQALLIKLKPNYSSMTDRNAFYAKQKHTMRMSNLKLYVTPISSVGDNNLEKDFITRFSEFPAFKEEFAKTVREYYNLSTSITNLTKVMYSIRLYVKKIEEYFARVNK